MTMTTTTTPTAGAPMTLRAKLEIAAAIAALLLGIYGWHRYRIESAARTEALAKVQAAKANFTQAAAQIAELKKQDAARAATVAKQIVQIRDLSARAKTPAQIAKWLPTQVPLPKPIFLEAPSAAAPEPNAAIPAADLPALRDFIVEAKECAVELPEAQKGLSSCQAQAQLSAQQLADVEKQRDTYKLALQGGTFWHRLEGGAKKIAIGAAIGAAAMCATGHCR